MSQLHHAFSDLDVMIVAINEPVAECVRSSVLLFDLPLPTSPHAALFL